MAIKSKKKNLTKTTGSVNMYNIRRVHGYVFFFFVNCLSHMLRLNPRKREQNKKNGIHSTNHNSNLNLNDTHKNQKKKMRSFL